MCLYVISRMFGYLSILSSNITIAALSVVSAFIPMSASAIITVVYLLLELLGLSQSVALMTFVLIILFYLLCSSYQARHMSSLTGVTVLYQLHMPLVIPLTSGLFGGMNEITTVLCGSVMAYYLKTVRENASSFLTKAVSVGALDTFEKMVSDKMFYLFLIAMLVTFVLVSIFRRSSIRHSWLLASTFGAVAGFVIMLGGYMFLGLDSQIRYLLIDGIVTLAIGIFLYFMFQDLDYERVESVQFEDDEYYYYVTAVPKVRFVEEDKEVKTITDDRKISKRIRDSHK